MGYGVSVGTTTLLPQFGLENKIDFLVDDDPNKGKFMARPGYDIPILPPAAPYERNSAVVVVFAWRYRPDPGETCALSCRRWQVIVPLPSIASMGPIDGVRQRQTAV